MQLTQSGHDRNFCPNAVMQHVSTTGEYKLKVVLIHDCILFSSCLHLYCFIAFRIKLVTFYIFLIFPKPTTSWRLSTHSDFSNPWLTLSLRAVHTPFTICKWKSLSGFSTQLGTVTSANFFKQEEIVHSSGTGFGFMHIPFASECLWLQDSVGVIKINLYCVCDHGNKGTCHEMRQCSSLIFTHFTRFIDNKQHIELCVQ